MRFDKEDMLVKKQLPPLSLMELLVLRVKAFEQLGQLDEALSFMNDNKTAFIDVNQREDMYGRLYVAKGFGEKAIEHYEKLLEQNSCNYDTYYKILAAKHIKLFDAKGKPIKLQGSDYETVKNTMAYYQKGFPRVDAPTRIALKWLQGDDFATSLKRFVNPLLIKGAPSVIKDLKEFYTDDNKV